MFETDIFDATDALESLRQLADNTPEALIQQRASKRLEIRTKLEIRPGNASQRDDMAVQVFTGDISSGGCQVLSPRPLLVGDIYWLAFSPEQVSIGALLARCLRCRMIREDAFETGFRFFESVDIASAIIAPPAT